MKSHKNRRAKTIIGWNWNEKEWTPIYAHSTKKEKKLKQQSLLKEIDDMLESAKKKSDTIKLVYTIACNKLPNGDPGSCVFIMNGKLKLKPGKDKTKKPCKIYFSHYIDTKNYVATVMRKEFEKMYGITVKAGRYRHMTCDFGFGKNKKPKKSE